MKERPRCPTLGCPLQSLWRCAQRENQLSRQGPAEPPDEADLDESSDLQDSLDPPSAAPSPDPSDLSDAAAAAEQERVSARLAGMTLDAFADDADEQGFFGAGPSLVPPLSDAETTETESEGPLTPAEQQNEGYALDQEDLQYASRKLRSSSSGSAVPSTPEASLRLVQQEFGHCDYLQEPERFLFSTHSALLKGVIIKGTVFVTTARVCYFALLPPVEDEAAALPVKRLSNNLHFSCSGANGVRRARVYCVLDSEGLTGYTSAKRRLRPCGSCHYSAITEVHAFPTDFQDRPHVVTYKYIRRYNREQHESLAELEFDDAETAASWRNELAAAFFRYHNERDQFKASVPYDRVAKLDQLEWQSFSIILSFDINTARPGQEPEIQRLDLGVLKQTAWVIDRIKEALLKAREEVKGWDAPGPRSPRPIMDIFAPSPSQAGPQRRTSRTNELRETPSRSSSTYNQTPADLSPSTSLDERRTGEYDDADLDERYAPSQRDLERFHFIFGLAPDEQITTVVPAYYVRSIPAAGQLAVSPKGVLFLRKTKMLQDVKILVPVHQLKGAAESASIVVGVSGMHVQLKGQADLAFNFKNRKRRDWAVKCIQALAAEEALEPHGTSAARKRASTVREPPHEVSDLAAWHLESFRDKARPTLPASLVNIFPRVVGVTGVIGAAKFTLNSLNVCCLTIGSRGDVQPYIALCQGLIKDGHRVCIATHPEYKEWVESYGIKHQSVGGDPSILMEVSVEHKMFAKDTIKRFREWFDRLLLESFEAVKGHDVLIESPTAFAGIHIAEALKIAYVRAFTMPFTRTGDFPHAFINAPVPLTRAYNLSTYVLFEQIMWRASSAQINRWRKHTLGLPATDLDHLHLKQVPFIYNFSEAVVPRPMEWPNSICISGYWFLEPEEKEYEPPEGLTAFMKKAREDGKPLVYIGFGSITIPDPAALTEAVIESAKAADVRMVLAKGWSSRRSNGRTNTIAMPPEIYQVESIPHEWLFQHVDAVMHHGGSGTTAATLRAGRPCLIHPFFGDQFFFANRVEKLGAGFRVKSLSAADLADAWRKATQDPTYREKAQLVSEQIQQENGTAKAIDFIYSYLASSSHQRGGTGVPAEEQVVVDDTTTSKKAKTATKQVAAKAHSKLSVLVDKIDGGA